MLLAFTFGCVVICIGATLLLGFSVFNDLVQSIRDYRTKNDFANSTFEMIFQTVGYIGFLVALCIGDYEMILLFINQFA